MAGPQDEINALTEQVAKLTARVYQLERRAGIEWAGREEADAPATVEQTEAGGPLLR